MHCQWTAFQPIRCQQPTSQSTLSSIIELLRHRSAMNTKSAFWKKDGCLSENYNLHSKQERHAKYHPMGERMCHPQQHSCPTWQFIGGNGEQLRSEWSTVSHQGFHCIRGQRSFISSASLLHRSQQRQWGTSHFLNVKNRRWLHS
jgi:hypothetical protein